MKFTKEQQKILKNYFTNSKSDVFVLTNLPEVIKGTLFSRYSRTNKDLRSLFLEEFVSSKYLKDFFKNQASINQKFLDTKKAEDFYQRILIGFGDDSVAELGGAHLAIENISVLATKSLEEHRLGLSFLEKSSRYVYFDKKINNQYQFYKPARILNSKFRDLYLETNNFLFESYSKIVRELQPILKEIYPGDENDPAYKFSIRAKACDLARGLLPLAAKTNLGVYGNGRAFEYLLINLYANPLEEVKDLAFQVQKNLEKVIKPFILRAKNDKGLAYQNYLISREKALKNLENYSSSQKIVNSSEVKLIEKDSQAIEKIIAALIFEKTNLNYKQAFQKALKLETKEKQKILNNYLNLRENRFQKPGRALEQVYFTFEITADWGVYKDLMRHRVLTRFKQNFTNDLGFFMPQEINHSPFKDLYLQATAKAFESFSKIKKVFPIEAQYLVLHSAFNRFVIKLNLREINHLTELRSSQQGHSSYRKIAQQIAKLVINDYPILKPVFKFVDFNDYDLERLKAFQKIQEKAKKLNIVPFEE